MNEIVVDTTTASNHNRYNDSRIRVLESSYSFSSSYFEWTCCNDDQTLLLLLYFAFSIIGLLLLNTIIIKPIRLIATSIHEICHAIMCYLTCGTVHKIHVYTNEGGVTHYQGGLRCCIVPAGYIGCSVWGMTLVILSGGLRTATVGTMIFIMALLGSLFYSPNRTILYLNIIYSMVLVSLLCVQWIYLEQITIPILQYSILFLGVLIGIISIQDIYSGTIRRTVEGSDAYVCYDEILHRTKCCAPKCIGIQWMMIAIVFQLFGIYIALVEMSNECSDISWITCFRYSLFVFNNGDNDDNDGEGWGEQYQKWRQEHNFFTFDGFFDN